jgi:hypothetical protein
MGKTEKRELVSRLTVLPLHLLKWRYQASGRGNLWRLSIAGTRDEIADLPEDNPSLRNVLDGAMGSAYRYARREAAIETGLRRRVSPRVAPWTFSEAADANFWPD